MNIYGNASSPVISMIGIQRGGGTHPANTFPNSRIKARITHLVLLAALSLGLSKCAIVKPYEREMLSDPIMDAGGHFSKQTLEQKFFSTREGSIGGSTGVGGGCGCAK